MLKVERIILDGFTGLALHEIRAFDFTIVNNITIVLGGNGCGKSSMLRVFLPVCPPKEDIKDGGSYTNISSVGDKRYKFFVYRNGGSLQCTITDLETGIDVVTKVNPKVYNSNVEELTGLTKEKKEMLNGEMTLTAAGSAIRRNWFTMLSTSDLSYALGFYQRLRAHAREQDIIAEHTRKKIAECKTKIIDDESERLILEERLSHLEIELRELSVALEKAPSTDFSINGEYVSRTLSRCSDDAMAFLGSDKPLYTEDDLEKCKQDIADSNSYITSRREVIAVHNRTLSELLDEDQKQKYLMRNHSGIQETIDTLTLATKKEKETPRTFGELFNNETQTINGHLHAKRLVANFATELSLAVDNIKIASPRAQLAENVSRLDREVMEYANMRPTIEKQLLEDQSLLQHIKETDETSCPNCKHRFKPGVGYLSEADVVKRIADGEEKLKRITAKLELLNVEREPFITELNSVNRIREIAMQYSQDRVLEILFKRFMEEDAFRSNRAKFGGLLSSFVEELDASVDYLRTVEKLVRAHSDWQAAAAALGGGVDTVLPKKIESVRLLIDQLQSDLLSATETHEALTTRLKTITKVIVSIDSFKSNYELLTRYMTTHVNNATVQLVKDEHRMKWDQYSIAKERFRLMEAEITQMQRLESELDAIVLRAHNAKLIIASFSPEKGILSRHLFISISRITEMLSKYIEHVWTYPLKVFPCDMSEGDLDYRFPYRLNESDEMISDVSRGSTAQKEIIDLTYRLTAYKALGLKQYPLLLDEPGSGFDESHRSSLVDFIKMLIDTDEFSQTIIISHNSDVHSRLNTADYCVLETEGVTLPSKYNETVKITYEGE